MSPSDNRHNDTNDISINNSLSASPPLVSPPTISLDKQHFPQHKSNNNHSESSAAIAPPPFSLCAPRSFPSYFPNPTHSSSNSSSTNISVLYHQRRAPQQQQQQGTTTSANKAVRFDSVTIHFHAIELGDSPSVSMGPPIALSWERVDDSQCYSVCLYEAARFAKRRTLEQMRIPPSYRILALKRAGISQLDIESAIQLAKQTKLRACTGKLAPRDEDDNEDDEMDGGLAAILARRQRRRQQQRRFTKPNLLEWFQSKRQRTTTNDKAVLCSGK